MAIEGIGAIMGGVVIGIGFEGMVKGVKRGIRHPGDHMAVGKTDGSENVQGQNGNDQKEQVSGSRPGSI